MSILKATWHSLLISLLIGTSVCIGAENILNPVDTLDQWDWRASDWGPMVNGVAMRVITRPEIAYGEPLELFIEFRVDNAQVPTGVRKWSWHEAGSQLLLKFENEPGTERSGIEMYYPNAAFTPWRSSRFERMPITRLTSKVQKLTCELGHAFVGSKIEKEQLGRYSAEEPIARLISKSPGSYRCKLTIVVPSQKRDNWHGSVSAEFSVTITEAVFVTYLHQLIVPSENRMCATCTLGVGIDTVAVRVRAGYFMILAKYTNWPNSYLVWSHKPYQRAEPTNTVIDLIPAFFKQVIAVDSTRSEVGIMRIMFFESPEPMTAPTTPLTRGCRVLWSAEFELTREYGKITSVRPAPDSLAAKVRRPPSGL